MDEMLDEEEPGRWYAAPVIVALAGSVAAAAISLVVPNSLYESAVVASGITEIIPAAAPPLGLTARLLIALGFGLAVAAVLLIVASRKETAMSASAESFDDDDYGAKPSWMDRLRGMRMGGTPAGDDNIRELADLPRGRFADRHPDAPLRRPISAHSELGTPLPPVEPEAFAPLPLVEVYETDVSEIVEHESFVLDAEIGSPFEPHREGAGDADWSDAAEEVLAEGDAPPEPIRPVSRVELGSLTLMQLVDRLEASLERLNARQNRAFGGNAAADDDRHATPATVASRAYPTAPADSQEQEMDAALQAALVTLQKMTARN